MSFMSHVLCNYLFSVIGHMASNYSHCPIATSLVPRPSHTWTRLDCIISLAVFELSQCSYSCSLIPRLSPSLPVLIACSIEANDGFIPRPYFIQVPEYDTIISNYCYSPSICLYGNNGTQKPENEARLTKQVIKKIAAVRALGCLGMKANNTLVLLEL